MRSLMTLGVIFLISLSGVAFVQWSRYNSEITRPELWKVVFPELMYKINGAFGVANRSEDSAGVVNNKIKKQFPDLQLAFSGEELSFGYEREEKVHDRNIWMHHFRKGKIVYLLGIYPFEERLFPTVATFEREGVTFRAFRATAKNRFHPISPDNFNKRQDFTVIATSPDGIHQVFVMGPESAFETADVYLQHLRVIASIGH